MKGTRSARRQVVNLATDELNNGAENTIKWKYFTLQVNNKHILRSDHLNNSISYIINTAKGIWPKIIYFANHSTQSNHDSRDAPLNAVETICRLTHG